MTKAQAGLFYALASAFLYALTVNIIPLAQAVGGTAIFYLTMRGLCNFFGSFAVSPNLGGLPFIGTSRPWLLILLSVCVAVQGFGYIMALHLIPISIATPLFFLFPVMTYLLQKLLRLQAIRLPALMLLLTSSFGVWLLAQGDGSAGDTLYSGIFWALLAAFAQAVVNIILSRLGALNAWQQLRASYLIPMIVFVGYFFSTQDLPSLEAIGLTALSAGIFLIGTVLFLQAVRLLSAIRTSNMMYIEPVLSVAFSVLLHEGNLAPSKMIAIVLILGATYGLETYERRVRVSSQARQSCPQSSQAHDSRNPDLSD